MYLVLEEWSYARRVRKCREVRLSESGPRIRIGFEEVYQSRAVGNNRRYIGHQKVPGSEWSEWRDLINSFDNDYAVYAMHLIQSASA